MDNNLFFGVSLTASFLGGMVALFAPCCITFLFPSYLGTIFKERTRIVYLTLVFALGLGIILVPVALGMKFIVSFFDQFHTTVYLLGALLMFVIPLFFLSLAYDKFTNNYLYKVKKNIEKPLKILASLTFIFSGIIIAYLALTGKIIMEQNMEYGSSLRNFIFQVSANLKNPLLDILVIAAIILLLIIMSKEAKNGQQKKK